MRSRYAGAPLVFAGGILGTGLRYLTGLGFAGWVGQEVGNGANGVFAFDIFCVNLLGAFLLALTVGFITGAGAPTAGQLRFRLFFGTGAMGGFTTYSTFAFQTTQLFISEEPTRAIIYALSTLLAGAGLSVLGLFLGRRAARKRMWEKNT